MIENTNNLPVTVIVGATSKWQADGRNTVFAHGGQVRDDDIPAGMRWGLGGALAQKFASEGHFVVLTTRTRTNASALSDAITGTGGACMAVEMDVSSEESVAKAFREIRENAGEPEVLIYNAGYMAGRELPEDQELLEYFPLPLFEVALATACRGPFMVAKEVLPAMRKRNSGSLFFSNNQYSLRGRKRGTGESLYYPRTMMRALAQALTEEYSEFGVHVANVVVDGFIDSPGTRSLDQFKDHQKALINPSSIADAFYYLHQQERTCWTHEIQLTPSVSKPSV
ncbi:SDR family oxidoreductase [Rhodococcus opacus]|uniref:SDR family oxidoreductase n=1 Tax=Rhodococcus opacus TaxID=37919 RepID=UPI002955505D|nr:SDR family oxidoreductase [Rhodococcus opacus]MDV7088948.1 SDR family oxidoreductase [Rhodococcus opacus]WKN60234.1 SDR family oxidoreductase [Rhodococcus opacus]